MKNFLKDSLFSYVGIWNIKDSTPIFPIGEGWENALLNIANYPKDFTIYELETEGMICSFATTVNPKFHEGKSKKILYELAFFPEDLIELHKRKYISGLKTMTEFEYRMEKYETMKKFHSVSVEQDGTLILYNDLKNPLPFLPKFPKPDFKAEVAEVLNYEFDELNGEILKEYYSIIENDYEYHQKFIKYPHGIKLTSSGASKVVELTQNFKLPIRLRERIDPLINIEYYATAIREVALEMEILIHDFHKQRRDFNVCKLHGQKLIESHIQECVKANDGTFNAGLKIYRQELITLNRFVRNTYMHGNREIQKEYFYRILFRQCKVYELMEQAFKKLLE